MNSKRISAILFVGLSLGFLGYLVSSAAGMPERVASHFDWQGQPDSWMSRSTYVLGFGLAGLAFPLFVVGLFFAVRFFPLGTINIPRRDYWLAPERRAQTFDFLMRCGFWLGCLLLALVAAVHYLILLANSRAPVALPLGIWVVMGLYLLAMLVWMGTLFLHFAKGRESGSAGTGLR